LWALPCRFWKAGSKSTLLRRIIADSTLTRGVDTLSCAKRPVFFAARAVERDATPVRMQEWAFANIAERNDVHRTVFVTACAAVLAAFVPMPPNVSEWPASCPDAQAGGSNPWTCAVPGLAAESGFKPIGVRATAFVSSRES
jgi:hypothetical protein